MVQPKDVPLGSGYAEGAKGTLSLEKQYQKALEQERYEDAERIKKQMQQGSQKDAQKKTSMRKKRPAYLFGQRGFGKKQG